MGLFSWLKRKGTGPSDYELEQAKANHKEAMESLRNGRKTLSTTLAQISLIRDKALDIIKENGGDGNDGAGEDIGEVGQDSAASSGTHLPNGLHAEGNQGVEPV